MEYPDKCRFIHGISCSLNVSSVGTLRFPKVQVKFLSSRTHSDDLHFDCLVPCQANPILKSTLEDFDCPLPALNCLLIPLAQSAP